MRSPLTIEAETIPTPDPESSTDQQINTGWLARALGYLLRQPATQEDQGPDNKKLVDYQRELIQAIPELRKLGRLQFIVENGQSLLVVSSSEENFPAVEAFIRASTLAKYAKFTSRLGATFNGRGERELVLCQSRQFGGTAFPPEFIQAIYQCI